MNLTVSQWIQIAAIAISAVISISRWVWDAKKASRSVQAIQIVNEATLIKPRTKTSLGTRVAFFAPLVVLLWQTLSPGAITQFDFGIMIFSGMTFTGFMVIQVVNTVGMILEGAAAESQLIGKIIEGHRAQVESMTRLVDVLGIRSSANAKDEENEQVASGNRP